MTLKFHGHDLKIFMVMTLDDFMSFKVLCKVIFNFKVY